MVIEFAKHPLKCDVSLIYEFLHSLSVAKIENQKTTNNEKKSSEVTVLSFFKMDLLSSLPE